MARRLDEEFLFAAEEPQQVVMRRLMTVLENRVGMLETARADYEAAIRRLETVSLTRINELLLPNSERLQNLITLGFLTARSMPANMLEAGHKIFIIMEGTDRDLFMPTPFVAIQRESSPIDYAIAFVISYD